MSDDRRHPLLVPLLFAVGPVLMGCGSGDSSPPAFRAHSQAVAVPNALILADGIGAKGWADLHAHPATSYAFGAQAIHASPPDKLALLGDCAACAGHAFFAGEVERGGGLIASYFAPNPAEPGLPAIDYPLHYAQTGWDPYWVPQAGDILGISLLTEAAASDLFNALSRRLGFSDGLLKLTHHTHHTGGPTLSMLPIAGNDDPYQGLDGWPHEQDILHESMAPAMLFRAFEGGERLLVASATESRLVADVLNNGLHGDPDYHCFAPLGECAPSLEANDLASARAQFDYIRRLAAYNWRWMCIVDSPEQAAFIINGNDYPPGTSDCSPATDPFTGVGVQTRLDTGGNTVVDHGPHLDMRTGSTTAARLAVVLGVELDNLSAESILSLQDTDDIQLAIPIHLADNVFGGTALYSDVFASSSEWTCSGAPDPPSTQVIGETRLAYHRKHMACAPNETTQAGSSWYFPSAVQDPLLSYWPSETLKAVRWMNETWFWPEAGADAPLTNNGDSILQGVIKGLFSVGWAWHDLHVWGPVNGLEAFPRGPQPGGFKNSKGLLTDSQSDQVINNQLRTSGMRDILRLMRAGLIVDVAHMGEASLNQTLALAQAQVPAYPIVDSHTNWSPTSARGDERAISRTQLWKIAQTGGMIGITSNAPDVELSTYKVPDPSADQPLADRNHEIAGGNNAVIKQGTTWWLPRYASADAADEAKLEFNVTIDGCVDNTEHDIDLRLVATKKDGTIVANTTYSNHSQGLCHSVDMIVTLHFPGELAISDLSTIFIEYPSKNAFVRALPHYHFTWPASGALTFGRSLHQPEWYSYRQSPARQFDLDYNLNNNRVVPAFPFTIRLPSPADAMVVPGGLDAPVSAIEFMTETGGDDLRHDSTLKVKLRSASGDENLLTTNGDWQIVHLGTGDAADQRSYYFPWSTNQCFQQVNLDLGWLAYPCQDGLELFTEYLAGSPWVGGSYPILGEFQHTPSLWKGPQMFVLAKTATVRDLRQLVLRAELPTGMEGDNWTLNRVMAWGVANGLNGQRFPIALADCNGGETMSGGAETHCALMDWGSAHPPPAAPSESARHLLLSVRPAADWIPSNGAAIKVTLLFRNSPPRVFFINNATRWLDDRNYEFLIGNPPGVTADDILDVGIDVVGTPDLKLTSVSCQTYHDPMPRWIDQAWDAMSMMSNWTACGDLPPQVAAQPPNDPAPAEVFAAPPNSPWCAGHGVAFGTDANGLATYGVRVAEPPQGDVTAVQNSYLDPSNALTDARPGFNVPHVFTLSKDGVAHYGMLADFVGTLGQYTNVRPGLNEGPRVSAGLNNSAQDFLYTWWRARNGAEAMRQTTWGIYNVVIMTLWPSSQCRGAQDTCMVWVDHWTQKVEWDCVKGGATIHKEVVPPFQQAEQYVAVSCP